MIFSSKSYLFPIYIFNQKLTEEIVVVHMYVFHLNRIISLVVVIWVSNQLGVVIRVQNQLASELGFQISLSSLFGFQNSLASLLGFIIWLSVVIQEVVPDNDTRTTLFLTADFSRMECQKLDFDTPLESGEHEDLQREQRN